MVPECRAAATFVRLIFEAEQKWANWDPAREINVGDYGKLDLKSGEFNFVGNLYHEPHLARYVDGLTKNMPKECPGGAGSLTIVSKNLVKVNVGAAVAGGMSGAKVEVGAEYEFHRGSAAVLLLGEHRLVSMPRETPLHFLIASGCLKDYQLVTAVIRAPRFTRYFADSDGKSVSIRLKPHVTGVGIKASVEWDLDTNVGVKECLVSGDHNYCYTPLYCLTTMKMPEDKKLRWYEGGFLREAFKALIHDENVPASSTTSHLNHDLSHPVLQSSRSKSSLTRPQGRPHAPESKDAMDKAPAVLRKPRDAKFVKPDTKDDGLHGVEGNKKDQKLKNLDSLKVQKPAEIQPGKERWHGTVDPAKSKKAEGGDIANAGKLSDPGKTNGHKSSAIVRKPDGKMNPNPSTPKGKAPSKARRQEKPVEGDKASNKKKEGADASKYGKHETDGKGKGKWSENTGAAKDKKPSHKRSSAKAAKVPTLALRPAIHEVLAIDKSGKVVVVSEEQIRVMTKSVTKDMFIGPQDLEAIKSP